MPRLRHGPPCGVAGARPRRGRPRPRLPALVRRSPRRGGALRVRGAASPPAGARPGMSVVAPALRAAAAAVRRLRLASSGGRVAWRRVGPGLWMVIDPGDAMDQRFMLGIYDPGLLLLLRDLVRPGDSALDVGAHCGYVTLHLARQVGPTGSVAAVEPDPRARDRLIEHLARNGFNHVAVIEAALGDGPGEAVLHLSRQVGWSTRFPNPTARPTLEGELRVRVHSLDGLARQCTLGLYLARLAAA